MGYLLVVFFGGGRWWIDIQFSVYFCLLLLVFVHSLLLKFEVFVVVVFVFLTGRGKGLVCYKENCQGNRERGAKVVPYKIQERFMWWDQEPHVDSSLFSVARCACEGDQQNQSWRRGRGTGASSSPMKTCWVVWYFLPRNSCVSGLSRKTVDLRNNKKFSKWMQNFPAAIVFETFFFLPFPKRCFHKCKYACKA